MCGIPAIPVPLSGVTEAIATTRTTYRGITVQETAGAVATVRVFDNDDAATGTLLETVSLAADESFSVFSDAGQRALVGIYVEVTGAVEGAIRIA